MNDFEIVLPTNTTLTVDVTDSSLYNYDFQSYSLLPLQEAAGMIVAEKIKTNLFSHVSEIMVIDKLVDKNKTEYVANISEYAKEKMNSGEWSLGIRKKTGETYAVIKDTVTGKNQSFITLDKRTVNDLGNLPELSAIQGQLAAITEQIENLNHLVERVEQGQYNDRFAGFFSARQLVIEGLAASNERRRENLLTSAIKTNNDTIAKLMLSIHQDVFEFIDLKTKKKDAKRINILLQSSIGYLNSAVQLNISAYTAIGEQQSLLATLKNYQSFIEQTLLREIGDNRRTVAWKIDNAHTGNNGSFNGLSNNVSKQITQLIDDIRINTIGVENYDKIENKDMHDSEM